MPHKWTSYRKDYMATKMLVARRKQKREAVEYKGGACEKCGYDKCVAAMEFHHRDPSEKDFQISGTYRSLARLKPELDKTQLLCANCHRELHDAEIENLIEARQAKLREMPKPKRGRPHTRVAQQVVRSAVNGEDGGFESSP